MLWLVICSLQACDDRVCETPSTDALSRVPERLSQTGLYADIASDQTASDVRPYAPQFKLWSDGADKRRWILLPAGQRINSADMDFWQFPIGTKLWKEFTRDGIRVETRMLYKYGAAASDWIGMAYAWQPDQADALAVPEGVVDAQGTPHAVPAAAECFACHGGTPSRVLGFSAIQLAYAAEPGFMDLRALVDGELLTDVPAFELAIPGDETQRAALGYLHANCGHCHNKRRPTDRGLRCFDPNNQLDFWLRIDRLDSDENTLSYRTAIGFAVDPGHPDDSKLIDLVSERPGMPPLATKVVDADAVTLLRRWIAEMKR